MKSKLIAFVAGIVAIILLIPSSGALPPANWTEGQEYEYVGHYFTDEYWTNDSVTATAHDGANVSFVVSYVNYNGKAQAFLVAFKNYTKDGNIATLPYQLFGMHYYTPQGQEVFIGAVLAFLLAYDDTYNGTGPGQNHMPDPGNEDIYFVLPFGIGNLTDGPDDYAPQVDAIPVQKLEEGHYQFGISYKNMYAKIIDANTSLGFLLSAALPLYLAKFSELTITYDVKIDDTTGVITAETFYTIGQVSKLWLWPNLVDPHSLPDTFGISAVHYVAMFTSNYQVENKTGYNIDPNIDEPTNENLTVKVGNSNERAFKIGYRGTFDLINEIDPDDPSTWTTIDEDLPAYNILVHARPIDKLLVAWQGKLSRDIYCVFAYALSKDLQSKYDSPQDLITNHAIDNFHASRFWYAVAFPSWKCYRVEHDPVYTAYTNIGLEEEKPKLAGLVLILIILLVSVAIIILIAKRVRRRDTQEGERQLK